MDARAPEGGEWEEFLEKRDYGLDSSLKDITTFEGYE